MTRILLEWMYNSIQTQIRLNLTGSIDRVYNYIRCGEGPEGNKERSFLTIVSNSGLMFGLTTISSKSDSIHSITISQTSPVFFCVCSTSRFKTLWKKEKLLVTSNFSFSHSVFYPFRDLSAIFIKFEIVVCKLSQLGRVQK